MRHSLEALSSASCRASSLFCAPVVPYADMCSFWPLILRCLANAIADAEPMQTAPHGGSRSRCCCCTGLKGSARDVLGMVAWHCRRVERVIVGAPRALHVPGPIIIVAPVLDQASRARQPRGEGRTAW